MLDDFLEEKFRELDARFAISARDTVGISQRISDDSTVGKLRAELLEKLNRLKITRGQVSSIFKLLHRYCVISERERLGRRGEVSTKITALQETLRANEAMLAYRWSPDFLDYLRSICSVLGLQLSSLEAEHKSLEAAWLRKTTRGGKRAKQSKDARDIQIHLIVTAFKRALEVTDAKGGKGDKPRNLTLLLLQSAGFGERTARGLATINIIKQASKRGEKAYHSLIES